MRIDGCITSWDDARGFGFIEPLHGGDEVFFHIKAFDARRGRPQPAQRVTFEVEIGPQGKKRACRVAPVQPARLALPRQRRESPAQWGTATLFAIPAWLVLLFLARPPRWLFGAYLLLSLFSFLAYAADKSAARSGERRTPESSLHVLALLGGWPGALLAQQFLRHKSVKTEFRAVFWATVVVNVAGLLALLAPAGRRLINF